MPTPTFQLEQALEILRNTPRALRSMLAGISDIWTHSNYGDNTFSPFDVVGHLIHGERTDWMVRVSLILQRGESQPFAPFDRYAMYEASRGKSIAELLDTFEELRTANLRELAESRLTPAHLELLGRHPDLGPVTLRQLLATWVVHDLNHIHQIAKAMAYQYREEIGPWREYFPFLT
ncbi:MAG: DinB family protein [Planctomycetes bacterium]|nr:DinB family protein [Planctomycetota bacterium]